MAVYQLGVLHVPTPDSSPWTDLSVEQNHEVALQLVYLTHARQNQYSVSTLGRTFNRPVKRMALFVPYLNSLMPRKVFQKFLPTVVASLISGRKLISIEL